MRKTRNEYDFEKLLAEFEALDKPLLIKREEALKALNILAYKCEALGFDPDNVIRLGRSFLALCLIDLEYLEVLKYYDEQLLADIKLLVLLKTGLSLRVVSSSNKAEPLGNKCKKVLIATLEESIYEEYFRDIQVGDTLPDLDLDRLKEMERDVKAGIKVLNSTRSQTLGSCLHSLWERDKVIAQVKNLDARRELIGDMLYLSGILEYVGFKEEWEEMGAEEDRGTRGRKAQCVANWIASAKTKWDKIARGE